MPTRKNTKKPKDTAKQPRYKRLTFADRCEVQAMLTAGDSFSKIARDFGMPVSTISREVMRNRTSDSSADWAGRADVCAIKRECSHKGLCGLCTQRLCKGCAKGCRAYCKDYVKPTCPVLQGAPWVCNACPRKKRAACRVRRYFYDAKLAQSAADRRLSESRAGIDLTFDELEGLIGLLAPLIRQGQSLEQIYLTHGDEIPVTLRTLYTYVADDVISGVANIDLNRKTRYAPRLKKRDRRPRDVGGRTYQDFQGLGVAAQASATEMDTVVGRVGGAALLTLYVRRFELMPVFLIGDETHDEIMERLGWAAAAMEAEEEPGHVRDASGGWAEARSRSFGDFFPVLLTDNGACFLGFADIEELGGRNPDGSRKTTLYYCDPYSSWQKGGIERSHEYIREVLPKGTSFDHLTHEDVSLLASHINSIPRPGLGGRSPYDLALPWLGERLLGAMGIRRVEPDGVIRKPWLLPAPTGG